TRAAPTGPAAAAASPIRLRPRVPPLSWLSSLPPFFARGPRPPAGRRGAPRLVARIAVLGTSRRSQLPSGAHRCDPKLSGHGVRFRRAFETKGKIVGNLPRRAEGGRITIR